jgi:amidohydrolase
MTKHKLLIACASLSVVAAFVSPTTALAQTASGFRIELDRRIAEVMPKVVAWRRDIHQHPELGNREVRTAKLVADHLKALGMQVRTAVAHTGVVGVLKGGKPGPVVALRADMDALPVTEQVNVPFKSTIRTQWMGQEVGVMHACGHDNHVAILMGVAEALAMMQKDVPGTVVFLFQPAEEGPPPGEQGGARLMVEQGVLRDPAPGAIFGLHVMPAPVGVIGYRPKGALAGADALRIVVTGRQTHGAMPWAGVDPIVVSAQIVTALQTVVSRSVNITEAPAIVTVGTIRGGVRSNIIPDSVEMTGTIRTYSPEMQKTIHARIHQIAEGVAASAGAKVQVTIDDGYPVTFNDPTLTDRMLPTLKRVAGDDKVVLSDPVTGSEDFSVFQQTVPGLFVLLGVTPPGTDMSKVAVNHSPFFFADEAALPLGVKALAHLATDWLALPVK